MDIAWPELAAWTGRAAVVGGVLAVDAQACLHLIVSQPLAAGVLTGWVCGDAGLGLMVGGYLQLVWAYGASPGRTPGTDVSSGVVAGVAVACAFSSNAAPGGAHIALGLLAALAVGWAGAPTERRRRTANEALAEWALRRLREGDFGALGRAHAASAALTALRGALAAGVGCFLWLAVGAVVYNRLAVMDFRAALVLIPCLGLASFFLGIVRTDRKGLAFFAAGVAVALLAGFRIPFP